MGTMDAWVAAIGYFHVLTVENYSINHNMWFVGMCLTKDNAEQAAPFYFGLFWNTFQLQIISKSLFPMKN
jgi:hypothetical protein